MAKEKYSTLEEALIHWPKIDWGRATDQTGQKYGMLEVIYRTENYNKKNYVICKCECGNYIKARTDSLKIGRIVSCECKKVKELIEHNKTQKALNIKGQRFGKLVALYPTEERDQGSIKWICHCDCGSPDRSYNVANLIRNHTLSCGCDKESHGVKKIKEILNNNNISYTCEATFDTCIFENTRQHARFDFFINKKYLIEYDGEQHFKFRTDQSSHWNNEENFIKTQERDKYKNQWCKENNMPLIRIPYTHLDKICLKDLLLETTTFLI